MNIFDVLKSTHQSYVSDISAMISDDQVALHALDGAKADALKQADDELASLISWHQKTYAARKEMIANSFDRQIAEITARVNRLAAIREKVEEGAPVQRPLEPLSEEEAAIIPRLVPRDLDQRPAVERAA